MAEVQEVSHQNADQKSKKVGNYSRDNENYARVRRTYDAMHTYQTYQFAMEKKKHYSTFEQGELTILEALDSLYSLVDETDPDITIPNAMHAFQTAEMIRRAYPDDEWFHLVGVIHDTGKVLHKWGEPQWSTSGQTFPVGCAFSEKLLFGLESFKDNPDLKHPVYSTKLGVYEENCGLENVTMSWGHNEYLYQVLKNHEACRIPEEGLMMIRFHSFYPWHSAGEYRYLCNEHDMEMLKWVQTFNRFDLYSKVDGLPEVEEVLPYYKELVEKYVPGKLKW